MCFKCNGIQDANQFYSYLALESQCLHKYLLFKTWLMKLLSLDLLLQSQIIQLSQPAMHIFFFF